MRHCLVLLLLALTATAHAADISGLAQSRKDDLRFIAYLTADHVKQIATDPAERESSIATLNAVGATKLMLEVYRGGVEIEEADLVSVRDYYQSAGYDVMGGIATVAGGGFGVESNRGNYWFNYQAEKTRTDLERVCRRAARVFDEFIVDDFLCTGDDSDMSIAAKGDRSWSEYRRALMTDIAKNVIIDPMRAENPKVRVIVKFPQWYDRFHQFGYEVEQFPALFDGVWVGTETRGRDTQRFGFTQTYEGFVNYRWLASLSGDKIAGAWFDHGDCDEHDFIEQAWTTVLAGAKDVVLFQYGDLRAGHGGHDFLRKDFSDLADLAKVVAATQLDGVAAYKPPHSEAGGDLYVMDFVGMFGVPLVPMARFPEEHRNIFLPTQAAADAEVVEKTLRQIERGANVVVTLGLLADAIDGDRLANAAGVATIKREPMQSSALAITGGVDAALSRPLDLEGTLGLVDAKPLLVAKTDGGEVPFLTMHETGMSKIFVLNVHTFSQADFDAVGEVFLAPRPLGLMELPRQAADVVRFAFCNNLSTKLSAPAGVTLFLLRDEGCVVQNHNDTPADVALTFTATPHTLTAGVPDSEGGVSNQQLSGKSLRFRIEPRSRAWGKQNK